MTIKYCTLCTFLKLFSKIYFLNMDLLGSILKDMDKQGPPRLTDEQKQMRKQYEKNCEAKSKHYATFRTKVEKVIDDFARNGTEIQLSFDPFDSWSNTIIHEVAEIAGLPSYSFIDHRDRFVIIFKREHAPSEKEYEEMRRTCTWSLKQARENIQKSEQEALLSKIEDRNSLKRKAEVTPNCSYKSKYEHLIGKDTDQAEKITCTNKTYGFVSSENKKDQRSIEQTLADLRAKKKQKTEASASQESQNH
ncbi:hypothetical protein B566_EDAN001699 [Ephemera danica]|nr:hypothetical protein B566_EDAN001699 [Ephemera danica]